MANTFGCPHCGTKKPYHNQRNCAIRLDVCSLCGMVRKGIGQRPGHKRLTREQLLERHFESKRHAHMVAQLATDRGEGRPQ